MCKFVLAAYINDPFFCAKLAISCDSIGVGLIFPDSSEDCNHSDCILLDLDDQKIDAFQIVKSSLINSEIIIGLTQDLSKTIHTRAIKSGFSIVFPKNYFCKNLSKITNHLSVKIK